MTIKQWFRMVDNKTHISFCMFDLEMLCFVVYPSHGISFTPWAIPVWIVYCVYNWFSRLCINWNSPDNGFWWLSINWDCPDTRFRRLSMNWNCPDSWFRIPSNNWNCVSNRVRVLSMHWNCLNDWFRNYQLIGINFGCWSSGWNWSRQLISGADN